MCLKRKAVKLQKDLGFWSSLSVLASSWIHWCQRSSPCFTSISFVGTFPHITMANTEFNLVAHIKIPEDCYSGTEKLSYWTTIALSKCWCLICVSVTRSLQNEHSACVGHSQWRLISAPGSTQALLTGWACLTCDIDHRNWDENKLRATEGQIIIVGVMQLSCCNLLGEGQMLASFSWNYSVWGVSFPHQEELWRRTTGNSIWRDS